jgi:hypothetical protein
VIRYGPAAKGAWNDFARASKNGTFLFDRNYMDYHADRIEDHSLMLFNSGHLAAILPANLVSPTVVGSHEGLTYGGLVLHPQCTLMEVMECFHAMLRHLHKGGIAKLRYKRVPGYYGYPCADEVAYCLFLLEAGLYGRECSLVVPMNERLPLQKRRKRQITKGLRSGLSIRIEADFSPFWNEVLTPRLLERYNVRPVHSVEEMTLLASRFPNNIKQFSVYSGNQIVAGITIYETPRVAHAQYIAANEEGRNAGALDFLMNWFLNDHYRSKQYFDFGGSTEQHGKALNRGLLEWKEGFGARCAALDLYEIDTANYVKLEPVLAA